jgi:hypothetical protein
MASNIHNLFRFCKEILSWAAFVVFSDKIPYLRPNFMPRLPDRFDLWVRKARESADPARQVDLVLGALVARELLYFLNVGTNEQPRIARAEIAPDECAVVFTDTDRLNDFLVEQPQLFAAPPSELPVIAAPMASALAWCVDNKVGLLINPSGEGAPFASPGAVATFVAEWKQRGGRLAAGFWIPNLTSEEEDFWQENGV